MQQKLFNSKLGITEDDVRVETSFAKLFTWQFSIEEQLEGIRGKVDDVRVEQYEGEMTEEDFQKSEQFLHNLQTVSKAQSRLLRMIFNRKDELLLSKIENW